jgi:hypothetical protein
MNFIKKKNIQSCAILCLLAIACNSGNNGQSQVANINAEPGSNDFAGKHFKGALSNGMKGDSISFDVSADGKKLTNLTFKGYWRCSGKLESTTAGPDGSFDIVNGKVSGHLSEPPNGGSTAWRFDLEASIEGKNASGTFRMNINNLGCDTYKLNWTAVSK